MYTHHVVNLPKTAHPMSQLKNTAHCVPSFRSGSNKKPLVWLHSHSFQQLLYCFTHLREISHNNPQQHDLQSHLKHHCIHWGAFNWFLNWKRSANHVTWSRGYSQCSSSTIPFFTMCCCDRILPHRSLQHFQMFSTQCTTLHMDKHLVNLLCAMPSCLKI